MTESETQVLVVAEMRKFLTLFNEEVQSAQHGRGYEDGVGFDVVFDTAVSRYIEGERK